MANKETKFKIGDYYDPYTHFKINFHNKIEYLAYCKLIEYELIYITILVKLLYF